MKYIQHSEIPASVKARIDIPAHARVILIDDGDVSWESAAQMPDLIVTNSGRVVKNRFGPVDALEGRS